jgi:opacity protein-like surface antigen
MKRVAGVVLSVFALLLLAGAAQSAEVNTAKGATSLVFQWSGLERINLSPYQGGVGVRHYLADGLAIRPGIVFSVVSETDESQTAGVADDETDVFDIGANVTLEKHTDVGIPSLSPWIGVGIGFESASLKVEGPNTRYGVPAASVDKVEITGFAFQAYVGAGFEWGFAKGMTLGGNYQAGVSIGSTKDEVTDGGTTETKKEVKDLRFGFSTMAVFLSVAIL